MKAVESQHEPATAVRRALGVAVAGLTDAFEPGELAFLAVTSKAELPIRDRLAWCLAQDLGEAFIVTREWRRADLAILAGSNVVAQVEAKALYSFDVLREAGRQKYLGYLRADAVKMQALAALATSDRFLLSIVTDVRGEIRPELMRHVVKYTPGITKAASLYGSDEVRSMAKERWPKGLDQSFGVSTAVTHLDGGVVWGLDVGVDVFLIGPLSEADHG
ncbi:hypothetical protein H0B56_08250 [Haloechinothrix sp. YIM 98757]|uniref:Uncharacterized protein n=1 Tax=Haloechinothrix aidingensis TaxID=2752311 RepID=A0A838A9P7_9PSEU|nr:hypothetical protein [Haloechinothrix aidingensis]MBA0125529.1 hypothetical protein [Haloechinothrix aidingensis]